MIYKRILILRLEGKTFIYIYIYIGAEAGPDPCKEICFSTSPLIIYMV